MAILEIKGTSLKGKNRIREWGSEWITKPTAIIPPEPNFILIVAQGDLEMKSMRWIHPKQDKDFQIAEWKENDNV